MTKHRYGAMKALEDLLWELPAEFREPVGEDSRESFSVIKRSNVRKVHKALLELQEYFGMVEE